MNKKRVIIIWLTWSCLISILFGEIQGGPIRLLWIDIRTGFRYANEEIYKAIPLLYVIGSFFVMMCIGWLASKKSS